MCDLMTAGVRWRTDHQAAEPKDATVAHWWVFCLFVLLFVFVCVVDNRVWATDATVAHRWVCSFYLYSLCVVLCVCCVCVKLQPYLSLFLSNHTTLRSQARPPDTHQSNLLESGLIPAGYAGCLIHAACVLDAPWARWADWSYVLIAAHIRCLI